MKLKYLFTMVVSALLFMGCSEDNDPAGSLGNLVLSDTYAIIPEAGGSVKITVKATEDWQIENVVKSEDDKFMLVDEKGKQTAAWFTISQLSGSKGDTELTITADKTDGGRETEIRIGVGEHTKQFFMIRQGSMEAQSATCAEVLAGPDGKTYRVSGVCTAIANTTYGNWYLNDGTGEVYIYGTLDADGKTQNFSSLNLEVGDVVELEGPKTTYNGTVELVDVTVIKITKSLAKIASPEVTMPKEGGELEVKVAYKGSGAYFNIPAENKSWITYSSTEYIAGVPTKIEQNPADTMVFKFNIAPNDLGTRDGSITFISSKGKNSSELEYTFTQEGDFILLGSMAFFNSLTDDATTNHRISGVITKIANTTYGNMYIQDATGEVYVYGTLTADGQSKQFETIGLEVGDVVTLDGPKGSYNGSPQMVNGVYKQHIRVPGGVTPIAIADFCNLPDDDKNYYLLIGNVAEIKNSTYGNFDISDETGSVYIYGVLPGWEGAKGQFASLGIKSKDTVVLIAQKKVYNGTIEAENAVYVSHTSAE